MFFLFDWGRPISSNWSSSCTSSSLSSHSASAESNVSRSHSSWTQNPGFLCVCVHSVTTHWGTVTNLGNLSECIFRISLKRGKTCVKFLIRKRKRKRKRSDPSFDTSNYWSRQRKGCFYWEEKGCFYWERCSLKKNLDLMSRCVPNMK